MGKIDETLWILPFFLIFSIGFSILPLISACDLLFVSDYQEFWDLLSRFYIVLTLFTRVIVANLQNLSFGFLKVLYTIFQSLSLINIVMIVMYLYLRAAKKETMMRHYRKGINWIAFLYMGMHLICAGIIIFGFSMTSLNAIIILFKCCGAVLLVGYIGIILISLGYLLRYMYSDE